MKNVATSSKSAKGFQLTINNDSFDQILSYLRSLKPNYIIACKESAPTTGHIHFHIYVQFPNARRLSLKKCEGAHIEKCFGSPKQNIDYIKKDGNIVIEEGAPRLNYVPSIHQAKEMSKEEREGLSLNMYNIVNKINAEENKAINVKEYYKKVEVYWIYGESGAGKTKWAVDNMLDRNIETFNEVKYDGTFWHGVQESCNVCLYDDWRDSHMKPTELINFIDYNRHVMNIKGGTVRNNYSLIYITSLQHPDEIYKNVIEESKKQWLRRITKIINII